MKKQAKKPTERMVKITLPDETVKDVLATMDALGINADCALDLMFVATKMRLAWYKTRKEYADAIRKVEKKYKVDVIGRMPGFEKGGDPLFHARARALEAEPKKRTAKKGKRK